MKKIIFLLSLIILVSCNSIMNTNNKKLPLFTVLKNESDGGANVQFCELLTELGEIKFLLNDKALKNKIKETDIKTSNFAILNMGEKPTGGYQITVEHAEENADSIFLYVKNTIPKLENAVPQEFTYPYCVVKINSKKGVLLK